MTTWRVAGPAFRVTVRACDLLAALGVLAMLALMATEIILRTFFDSSTLLADEYSGYALVAVSSLGLAGALRSGSHVRLGLVLELLSRRKQSWYLAAQLVSALSLAAFVACLTYYLGNLALTSHDLGTKAPTITRTPVWIPQAVLVVGLVVLELEAIRRTLVTAAALLRGGELAGEAAIEPGHEASPGSLPSSDGEQ